MGDNGGNRLPEPAPDPLLPARLSAFAPPDLVAEGKTRERLRAMTPSALRTRRGRIDKRLYELGLSVGEPALKIPSVRGTGLIDLDRILRKLDALDRAREEAQLEREAVRPEGLIQALAQDLDWLSEAFTAREIRTRRNLLVSELGLALCAAHQRVLEEYAPHVRRLLEEHVDTARKIDEMFVQAKLLDEEFEARARAGQGDGAPKQIERVLSRALDSVDDVSAKVGDALVDFGKTAAKSAVVGGGQAAWALARGAAKGAWSLGTRGPRRDDDDDLDAPPAPLVRPALPVGGGPPPAEIPELIRKLAKLRADGILDDDEFRRKKAELLARL
ncbi:MAG: SHOCT domain-containing protein [Planctomycetes bacterium]|nr:SHOCT domain-containing protein [Planctomycetota bacterium]